MPELPPAVVYRAGSLVSMRPFWGFAMMAVLAALILLFTAHPWLAGAAFCAAFLTGALLARESRLVVGADGVLLEWLWRSRFIPRAAIAAVSTYESGEGSSRVSGIALALTDGTSVGVPLGKRSVAEAEASVRTALGFELPAGAGVAAALLARGDDSAPAWFARLRSVPAAEETHYRVAAVPTEELWAVVENPAATASERAAAAVALRGTSSGDDTKVRLSRVATETADTTLRVFLERAASENDEGLEGAFVELDERIRQRV